MRRLWSLAYVAAVTGCSLAVSLDGLSGGGATNGNGGADGATFDAQLPGNDGAIADDASSDPDGNVSPPDGGGGGKKDGGTKIVNDGGFECNGAVVTQCSDCSGSPQPCVTCDSSGDQANFCAAAGAQCRDLAPTNFMSCTCTDANDCPAPFQVCHSNSFCHTCGEPQSDGEACKVGGSCTASSAMCN